MGISSLEANTSVAFLSLSGLLNVYYRACLGTLKEFESRVLEPQSNHRGQVFNYGKYRVTSKGFLSETEQLCTLYLVGTFV